MIIYFNIAEVFIALFISVPSRTEPQPLASDQRIEKEHIIMKRGNT